MGKLLFRQAILCWDISASLSYAWLTKRAISKPGYFCIETIWNFLFHSLWWPIHKILNISIIIGGWKFLGNNCKLCESFYCQHHSHHQDPAVVLFVGGDLKDWIRWLENIPAETMVTCWQQLPPPQPKFDPISSFSSYGDIEYDY